MASAMTSVSRPLAVHPRGEQWRQLDVTVANLTFDQLYWMSRFADVDVRSRCARSR
jgi:hypothetical protein